MFSFVCRGVFLRYTLQITFCSFVLDKAHYINIHMAASHSACLCVPTWDFSLLVEVVVDEWIGRNLQPSVTCTLSWCLESVNVCVCVWGCVWMSCCVGILHLCSFPHQYSLLTSTPPSSAALYSCQAFQQKRSSAGCSRTNNIPECHIIFGILNPGILHDLMYLTCVAKETQHHPCTSVV